jgi:hypothetical protein
MAPRADEKRETVIRHIVLALGKIIHCAGIMTTRSAGGLHKPYKGLVLG